MIKGIGVDTIEIDRIGRVIKQWDRHFLRKIFTPREIAYCQSKPNTIQHFAVRFAAKEAFAKAIATGWRSTFRWQDVEIENDLAGKPKIVLHGKLEQQFSLAAVHLSLSHTHTSAVAMVVLEAV
jgi:holo-[acyl-carrier protein] synthase